MTRVLIATSSAGKLRDFAGAAASHQVEIAALPGFASLPEVEEDGATFEANARKKAEYYSRAASGELVLADDSGLAVDALGGAPGVRSARYAADATGPQSGSRDAMNNARLLRELTTIPDGQRSARFVCVIAVARAGDTVATFRGEAGGIILRQQRGTGGFGYDPLFFVPELGKTFAELSAEEKAAVSHRGRAFRRFLEWLAADSSLKGNSDPSSAAADEG
ncbi:MAG: RdgB/HAM1 family non-canonical purine NTP pyrophosphatase [Terriglobales bacterium]